MNALRIVFVGQTVPGSRTLQRIRVLGEMGHTVTVVPTQAAGATYEDVPSFVERLRHRLRIPPDRAGANDAILACLAKAATDVLWLDRAVTIRSTTLRAARGMPRPKIVWYAEDDMMNPRHLSRTTERALPLFDLWVTTKSMNALAHEMPAKGVRRILFVDNSYDPAIHRPVTVTAEEKHAYGAAVSFVGTYEAARARSLAYLARQGLEVRVWGNGWQHLSERPATLRVEERPVYDDDYAKVVAASTINLCFLRKDNRDLQTCRSIEIPAMAGLMVHERNDEICRMFEEGKEAVYFDDDIELAAACRAMLSDEPRRRRIAEAAHARVTNGCYRHQDRLALILETAMGTTR